MSEKELIEISKDNLSRVLGFFPRVDTLLSVILAINLGMLAVIVSNAPPVRQLDWYSLFAVVFLLVSTITFFHLYKCAFPRLDGGVTSLIYFREIAGKTELAYREEFKKLTESAYLDDLLEQTWRNSTILKEKFDHLKWAFIFLIISIVFWLPAVLNFASKHTESFLTK